MRVPWGSYHYTSGAWSNAVSSITVSSVVGSVDDFEIVAVYADSNPSSVTASDGGGSYTYIGFASAAVTYIFLYARLLTNTNTHSVTVGGSAWNPTGGERYRRVSVYIVSNPMNYSIAQLSSSYKKVEYLVSGGSGTTTYFPDCTDLKTVGGYRLDIGVAFRQWDNTGSGTYQQGGSVWWESFPSPLPTAYTATNGNGVSYNLSTSSARCIEDVGLSRTSSVSLSIPWVAPILTQIPYTNKCYNTNSGTYVSLSSYLAAFSFVIPNYGSTKVII